jgi:uncharacterized protein YycO
MYRKKAEVILKKKNKEVELIAFGINETSYNFIKKVAKYGMAAIDKAIAKQPALAQIVNHESIIIAGREIEWQTVSHFFKTDKYPTDFKEVAKQPAVVGRCLPFSDGTTFYWDYYRNRYHYYHVGLYSIQDQWKSLVQVLDNPTHILVIEQIIKDEDIVCVPELHPEDTAVKEEE